MTLHESKLRARVAQWVRADHVRMRALADACALGLPDWCIAAGFVRNLVWDRLHDYDASTPLADIDLIYYDAQRCGKHFDGDLEKQLNAGDPALRWSVKNQARMHVRNGDPPYRCTEDAMSHWPEMETAIGVRLDASGRVVVISPFGLASLFALRITPNPKRSEPGVFAGRLTEKRWLSYWPRLVVSLEK